VVKFYLVSVILPFAVLASKRKILMHREKRKHRKVKKSIVQFVTRE
jgi:hypothetical protein